MSERWCTTHESPEHYSWCDDEHVGFCEEVYAETVLMFGGLPLDGCSFIDTAAANG